MQNDGWRYGPQYDPDRKTHDALVEFERLSDTDRCGTVCSVKSADVERYLASLVYYPRGPERPFDASELRVGLPVGLARDLDPTGADRGSVTAWTLDPNGSLQEIRVRWSDGSEQSHHP